jgi:hypothetical protein
MGRVLTLRAFPFPRFAPVGRVLGDILSIILGELVAAAHLYFKEARRVEVSLTLAKGVYSFGFGFARRTSALPLGPFPSIIAHRVLRK